MNARRDLFATDVVLYGENPINSQFYRRLTKRRKNIKYCRPYDNVMLEKVKQLTHQEISQGA
jgi:hypothetical protein